MLEVDCELTPRNAPVGLRARADDELAASLAQVYRESERAFPSKRRVLPPEKRSLTVTVMAKAPRPWIVTRHGPIEKLEDNLWVVEGDVPGVPFRRRMSIIRRGDVVSSGASDALRAAAATL
jgi:hypothetical protein